MNIDEILDDAWKTMCEYTVDGYVPREALRWYAWPQMFSTHAASFKWKQVIIVHEMGVYVVYHDTERQYVVERPSDDFLEALDNQNLAPTKIPEYER